MTTFTETKIPTDDIVIPEREDADEIPAFLKSTSDGPTCRVCGKEIGYLYSGKGRKPVACEDHKRSSGTGTAKSTRTNGSVEQAVQSLEGAYQLVGFALMLFAPQAASLMNASIPDLSAKNRSFLQNDPELVKAINKIGKTGGRAAFFISQAMVLGPVAMIAIPEIREKFASDDSAPEVPFQDFA